MTLLDTDNTSLMMTLSEKCSNGDYQRTQDDDDSEKGSRLKLPIASGADPWWAWWRGRKADKTHVEEQGKDLREDDDEANDGICNLSSLEVPCSSPLLHRC